MENRKKRGNTKHRHTKAGLSLTVHKIGKRTRKAMKGYQFNRNTDVQFTGMIEAVILQWLKESSELVSAKRQYIKATHLAQVVGNPESKMYGILPKKIAGEYVAPKKITKQ